jgi:SWI/SNF-related matrix-associated actin-dependent regulator of chromatin subfamily A-like protein 1
MKATQVNYKGGGLGIKIEFKWDKDLLELVKSIPGRKYQDTAQGKFWTCPLTLDTVWKLQKWGFTLDPLLLNRITSKEEPDKPIIIPTFKIDLFPFQKEAVAFIDKKYGRAIVGDEMGLGKTITALAWLELHPEERPAVIVVPSSLKYNWVQEINKCLSNPDVQVLSGTEPSFKITAPIVISNYEIIAHRFANKTIDGVKQKVEVPNTGWIDPLIALQPKVLIIDEIHHIKESSANQTKAVIKLGKKCQKVIGLGGTFILNRPIEGYNALKLIDPAQVPATKFEYGMRYCAGRHNGFGWQFNGASHTEELHSIIKRVMIRRLKADVMKDLPSKIRSVVPLEINNRTEYENAKEDFIAWIEKNKGNEAAQRASRAQAFTRIETLKTIATKGKLNSVIEWIDDFLQYGRKLVLFTQHIAVAQSIHETYAKSSVMLIGGTKAEEAQALVNKFQKNDKIKIIVGTLDNYGRPLGVGHTLTAASDVAFLELPWSPGVCDQAEDRVLRIGQTADCVNAYYLVADRTVEITIAQLLDDKRKVLKAVMDGKEVETDSLLIELLNDFYEKGI